MEPHNIFAAVPERLAEEEVQELLAAPGLRLERIVSTGQTTGWLEAEQAEWVLLLAGAARLEFADGAVVSLGSGDFVAIAPGRVHRVQWTDPSQPTVWLALHYAPG